MVLQTQNLVMVGLSILNDTPTNPLQPPLLDGIHLRWAFKREHGFPWYGYYLFRRLHRKSRPRCLSEVTSVFPTGSISSKIQNTSYGQVSSDQDLVLTDDFPPSGSIEFDLDNRSYLHLKLSPDNVSYRVEVQIGFRKESELEVTALLWGTSVAHTLVSGKAGDIETIILDFDAITDLEFSSGPMVLVDVCLNPVLRDATAGWEPLPDFSYPMCMPVIHPEYPCTLDKSENLEKARDVAKSRIRYGQPDQFTSTPIPIHTAGTITIDNDSPIVIGAGTNWTAELVGWTLQVNGDLTAYSVVMVISPDKLVLSRSYDGASGVGNTYAITQDVFGQLHDSLIHLVQGGLVSGDMMKRSLPVPIHTGGTISVKEGSSTVTGAGTNWNTNMAGLSIKVAEDKAAYSILSIDSLTQLTLDRNYMGMSGTEKAYIISSALQPPEMGGAAPRMPKQYPLDLVLLGTLHPAIAQMVGLYWVDQKADPAVSYDYLIMADYEGRFVGLKPHEIVGLLRQIGFSDVDGYIVFNKKIEPAPKLSVSEDLRIYALPSSAEPKEGGILPNARNTVGLRWKLGLTEQGVLQSDKPLMYHMWRAKLGEEEPASAPSMDRYQVITKNRPILIAQSLLSGGEEPQRPPNWPPFEMHAFDKSLPDGWYSYQVSGIDIFGRHSPNSAPAVWYQWKPVPDPRPWYYKDPAGGQAVHPFAVQLLDKVPPPLPTGIEAYALDPADPTIHKDAA